tara:strand:+ start:1172 stop:2200 length:1029 start_codon:yes stop_codon:yes gene_type:complete
MLKVKISMPHSEKNLNISQFISDKNNTFCGKKFFLNSDIKDPDYWFVFEDINSDYDTAYVDPKKIYYLNTETSYEKTYFLQEHLKLYLDQFHFKFGCYTDFTENYYSDLPFLPWMINKKHNEISISEHIRDINFLRNYEPTKKSKLISVICSDKIHTVNHKLRYEFIKKLKNHFGDDLDWFGRGVNRVTYKWDAIHEYKYQIVLENDSRNNLVSEKLYDSFLGLSFPFYYGASNLNKYFDNDSFKEIDILDTKYSIKTIEEGISSKLYENNLEKLKISREKVLNELNLFERISKLIDINENNIITSNKEECKIYSVNYFWKSKVGIKRKIKNTISRKLRLNQ